VVIDAKQRGIKHEGSKISKTRSNVVFFQRLPMSCRRLRLLGPFEKMADYAKAVDGTKCNHPLSPFDNAQICRVKVVRSMQ
jgi:hypothetical protein